MEDQLGSIFSFHQGYEQLRQKLSDTILELETAKKVEIELLNLLEIAYQERDQAREQLQNLVKVLGPSNSNAFSESLPAFPAATKAKSSVTVSNSPSHISSCPVDHPLLEPVSSSPELLNVNVNLNVGGDNNRCNNLGFEKPAAAAIDHGSAVIDYLARGKLLPQKGKLVEAVKDAGPLLQTLLVAGPLLSWRNPPPLSSIKIPPLKVKEFDSPVANTWNSIQKPTILPSSHSSGGASGFWRKQLQVTSKGGVNNQLTSRNLQRHQYL